MKRVLKIVLLTVLMIAGLLPAVGQKAQAAGHLLISEYVEGTSYNKAIEIYNPTKEAVDLSTYSLVSFLNGASETSGTVYALKLSGTLEPGKTYVIANQNAGAEVLAKADLKTSSSVMNFNGDDTLVLFDNYNAATKTGDVNDSIGQVGFDPGTQFGSDVATVDMTLVRTTDKLTADTDIHNAYDPAVQFIALPKDTFTELGRFNGDVTAPAPETAKSEYHVNVDRVVDGDTIKISPAIMGSNTIRFVNIDTPETYHMTTYDSALIDTNPDHNQKYHGEIAKKALNELLQPGMPVTVKVNPDHITDDYGRVLGQVVRESDQVNTNLEMVKRGMASTYFIWPVLSMEDYHTFQQAVADAQSQKIGIWQTEHPLMELAFQFRARYEAKGLQRFVGDSETKLYYNPEAFDKVPVSHRIFFSEEEAVAQGYKPASNNGGPVVEEKAKPMTIQEARTGGKGTKAIVKGTVTHIDGYNIYIQDETAGMVIRSKTVKPSVGDVIEAEGITGEYFGLYQIETEAVKTVGTNTVNPADVTAINETEEAELVRLSNVTIQSLGAHDEYTVIDDAGHQFIIKTKETLEVGQKYAQIDGVVTYSYDNYKVLPVNIVKEKPVEEKPVEPKQDVSGFVFYDQNHNGKFDQPDRLLNGVTVEVLKDGKLIETVTTDQKGQYTVSLVKGDYEFRFEAPASTVETFKNMTTDDKDSDIEDGKVSVSVSSSPVKDITAGFTKNVGKMKKK